MFWNGSFMGSKWQFRSESFHWWFCWWVDVSVDEILENQFWVLEVTCVMVVGLSGNLSQSVSQILLPPNEFLEVCLNLKIYLHVGTSIRFAWLTLDFSTNNTHRTSWLSKLVACTLRKLNRKGLQQPMGKSFWMFCIWHFGWKCCNCMSKRTEHYIKRYQEWSDTEGILEITLSFDDWEWHQIIPLCWVIIKEYGQRNQEWGPWLGLMGQDFWRLEEDQPFF